MMRRRRRAWSVRARCEHRAAIVEAERRGRLEGLREAVAVAMSHESGPRAAAELRRLLRSLEDEQ